MKKVKEEEKKELTPEDAKIKGIVDKHLSNIEEVVMAILAQCLASDLKFYDVNYVSRRIIQVIEDTVPKIDFKFPELETSLKGYFSKKLDEMKSKTTIGLFVDDSREAKAEPIVHSVINMVVSPEFMDKDKEWMDSYIEETNRIFVINLVKHLFEATFSKLDFSLEQSFSKAQDKLFCFPKATLPLKTLDFILKS